jgi:hypothetical protein
MDVIRDQAGSEPAEVWIPDDLGIRILQKFYALWLVAAPLAVGYFFFTRGAGFFDAARWASLTVTTATVSVIYVGLRRRRSWVAPIVLFTWLYLVLPCPRDEAVGVVGDGLSRWLWTFQVWIVTHPAIQELLQTNDATVF